MTRTSLLTILVCGLTATMGAASVFGQSQETPATAPAAAAAAPTTPSDGSLVYQVIAVAGKVRVGKTGLSAEAPEGWALVKVGDELQAGQQVSVPLRGALKVVARPADPPTVLLFETTTLVNISELSLTGGTAKARIELAHGAVRAGVAEGTTRSDMEIKCPAATLSKRGTDIFRFEYHNGRFVMSLSDQGRGMIQAIQMQSTAYGGLMRQRSRFVLPGQFVTHQMASAIDMMQFDRQINVNDMFGMMGADQLAALMNQHGLGIFFSQGGNTPAVLEPTGGPAPPGGPQGLQPLVGALTGAATLPFLRPTNRHQTSGDFGVGQGTLPNVFGSNTAKALRERAIIKAQRDLLKVHGRK